MAIEALERAQARAALFPKRLSEASSERQRPSSLAACSSVPIELVEVGILVPQGPEVAAWRFGAVDLMRARRLTRLQRDFGASTEAAAVILDLLDEIERLRAQLRRAGLEIG